MNGAERFAARTWRSPQWTMAELSRAEGSRAVGVVLPALDEEVAVGGVVRAVLPLPGSVVDECVLVDGVHLVQGFHRRPRRLERGDRHRPQAPQPLTAATGRDGCDVPADGTDPTGSTEFTRFVQVGGEWLPDATELVVADRPPMREVPASDQHGGPWR